MKITDPHHYRFCYEKCEDGTFSLTLLSDNVWSIRFQGNIIAEYDHILLEDHTGKDMADRMAGPPAGYLDTRVSTYFWGKPRILIEPIDDIYLERSD